jgi:hypothetical protein
MVVDIDPRPSLSGVQEVDSTNDDGFEPAARRPRHKPATVNRRPIARATPQH